MSLWAVTAPEEPPLILCSNNGAPPTPVHPCTTRILKSIDFNEISIPVSELLLCFVLSPAERQDLGLGRDLCTVYTQASAKAWEEKGQRP